jgi:hypothetical protein
MHLTGPRRVPGHGPSAPAGSPRGPCGGRAGDGGRVHPPGWLHSGQLLLPPAAAREVRLRGAKPSGARMRANGRGASPTSSRAGQHPTTIRRTRNSSGSSCNAKPTGSWAGRPPAGKARGLASSRVPRGATLPMSAAEVGAVRERISRSLSPASTGWAAEMHGPPTPASSACSPAHPHTPTPKDVAHGRTDHADRAGGEARRQGARDGCPHRDR